MGQAAEQTLPKSTLPDFTRNAVVHTPAAATATSTRGATSAPNPSSRTHAPQEAPRLRSAHGIQLFWHLPLPDLPPSAQDINPLSGRTWTAAELQAFPRGYPGFPRSGHPGVRMRVAGSINRFIGLPEPTFRQRGGGAVGRTYNARTTALPTTTPRQSEIQQLLSQQVIPHGCHFLRDGRVFRSPRTMEEVEALYSATRTAGNYRAVDLWGQFINELNRIPVDDRTDFHRDVLRVPRTRAEWLPKKKRPARSFEGLAGMVGTSTRASLPMVFENPPVVDEDVTMAEEAPAAPTTTQSGNAATLEADTVSVAMEIDTPTSAAVDPTSTHMPDAPDAGEPAPDKPTELAAKSKATKVKKVSRKRAQRDSGGNPSIPLTSATTPPDNDLSIELEIICSNRSISLPGIVRNDDGDIQSLSAARGLLRVIRSGSTSPLSPRAAEYLGLVVEGLRTGRITHISARVQELAALRGELCVDRVAEHLESAKDDSGDEYARAREDIEIWASTFQPDSSHPKSPTV